MFFILSLGRSGSRTIAQVLSQSPNCLCAHEPPPRLIAEAPQFHYGQLDKETLKDILTATRTPVQDGRIYGESSQKLSLIVPVLREAFPEGRYVWLLRDARGFVCSCLQRNVFSDEEMASPVGDWQAWRLHGDTCGDMPEEQWRSLDQFQRICWLWDYTNRIINRDLNELAPDDTFKVRIEDLRSSLPDLCEFLGLQSTSFVVEKTNRRRLRVDDEVGQPMINVVDNIVSWRDWSQQQRHHFEHWCGTMMDEHYPEWKDADGQWNDIETDAERGASTMTATATTEGAHAEELAEIHDRLSEIQSNIADLLVLKADVRGLVIQREAIHNAHRLDRELQRVRARLDRIESNTLFRMAKATYKGLRAPIRTLRGHKKAKA